MSITRFFRGRQVFTIVVIGAFIRIAFDEIFIYSPHLRGWYHSPIADFQMFFYMILLYLKLGSFPYFFMEKTEENMHRLKASFRRTSYYWLFLGPAVPFVSFLFHSNYNNTVPIFAYFPGFMVEHNYLPAGMIFVIPFIVYIYIVEFKKVLNTSWMKAIGLSLLINNVLYLINYQYLLRFSHYLWEVKNFEVFFSAYTVIDMILGIPAILVFKKCFDSRQARGFNLAVTFAALFFVSFLIYGLILPASVHIK